MLFKTVLVSIALALAGCAVQPTNLQPASGVAARAPSEDFVHEGVAGLMRVQYALAIKAGRYVPVGQNEAGIFFLSEQPDNFRIFYLERKRFDGKRLIAVYAGGIFIPHSASLSPRFFILTGAEKLVVVSDAAISKFAHGTGKPAADITSEEMMANLERPVVPFDGAAAYLIREFEGRGFTFWGPQGEAEQTAKSWLLGMRKL
ncbi:hypothetical protein [Variovorax paradoxus]|nr:hypothetical protein [Variovorax paradoxus]